MSWHLFESGDSIGQRGSEAGTIMRDDEHCDGARITLKRDADNAPFAITCGIYGWMFHTRFLGAESEALSQFESMKAELDKIVGTIPLDADPEADAKSRLASRAITEFVERFP